MAPAPGTQIRSQRWPSYCRTRLSFPNRSKPCGSWIAAQFWLSARYSRVLKNRCNGRPSSKIFWVSLELAAQRTPKKRKQQTMNRLGDRVLTKKCPCISSHLNERTNKEYHPKGAYPDPANPANPQKSGAVRRATHPAVAGRVSGPLNRRLRASLRTVFKDQDSLF